MREVFLQLATCLSREKTPKWNSGILELFSGFQSPEFQIPQGKILPIPESGFPHMR